MQRPASNEPRPHRFTVEEYHRMIEVGIFDENERIELLDGDLVDMPAVGNEHAAYVNHISRLTIERLGERVTLSIQNPVRLGEETEPAPDISILSFREDEYVGALPRTEDIHLLIEIADTSLEYDREQKIPLYARCGVPFVWLVNLRDRVVDGFHEPSEEGYRRTVRPASNDALPAPDALTECRITPDDLLLEPSDE